MEFTHEHCLNGYVFHIVVAPTSEGRFRGRILLSRRGDTCTGIEPALAIDTPNTFKSFRGAQIEASAYAHELIHSGAILSAIDPLQTKRTSSRYGVPRKNNHLHIKKSRAEKTHKAPMYYVFLSTLGNYTFQWSETKTLDCDTAVAAFYELVNYTFLNDKPYQVSLKLNKVLAIWHSFDSPPCSEENWTNQAGIMKC
ncbi:hypothetical protein ABIE30_003166 [Janthinobacterium lividum]|uniref:hypothetical protein n=1 Tax=Janthinobacterium lividum TaxID=29581 RepID=UPI003D24AE26